MEDCQGKKAAPPGPNTGSPFKDRTISAVTIARVLGVLGKTVIAIGIIILLFAVFQLWGTGILEARSQQDLGNDFDELLEASSVIEPAPALPARATTPASPDTPGAAPEPAANTAPSPAEGPTPSPAAAPSPAEGPTPSPTWLAMLYRGEGSAIARMQIPRIGLDKTVVEGVRVGDLRKGPGHYPTTPLPGQAGNAAIAGHRTTYGAPFGDIHKLLPGDEISVATIQGQFTYTVVAQGDGHGHLIVPPTAVEVLDQDFSDHPNRLTLTACHPRGSARQRIIVVAELRGEPAPTPPRPSQEAAGVAQLADENVAGARDNGQTPTPAASPEPAAAPGPEEPAATPSAAEPTPAPSPEPAGAEPAGAETAGVRASAAANPVSVADSFGEGLDGDSGALGPAILWGLATLAVWFSALFAGQRWRRLPAYAISALPFLFVMFMAFWHIDQILPSY